MIRSCFSGPSLRYSLKAPCASSVRRRRLEHYARITDLAMHLQRLLSRHWVRPDHRVNTNLLLFPRRQLVQRLLFPLCLNQMTKPGRVGGRHPLESMRCVLNARMHNDIAGLFIEQSQSPGACYHGSRAGSNLQLRPGAIVPSNRYIWAFRRADGQKATNSRRRNVVERAVEVPLIEPTCTRLTFLRGDMRWQMEVHVVDTFHFEVWRKLVMIVWQLTTTEYMHLRLHGYRWPVGDAIYIYAFVRGQIWICAMREAAGLFIWVKAAYGQSLSKPQVATVLTLM